MAAEQDCKDDKELLRAWTCENTASFAFQDAKTVARVVDIHDGDTIKGVLEVFPGRFFKISVRLLGIDTAEITSRDPAARAQATSARDLLVRLVSGSSPAEGVSIQQHLSSDVYLVRLNIHGMDKYGRVLADVLPYLPKDSVEPAKSFSNVLLHENMAVLYSGGNKAKAWTTMLDGGARKSCPRSRKTTASKPKKTPTNN